MNSTTHARPTSLAAGKKGFTLIELLVVIAIIGILSSMLLAGVTIARRMVRKVVAATEVKSIETALRNYYTTYQRWPSFAQEQNAVRIDNAARDKIADVLGGEDFKDNNPRKLQFMEFSKKDRNDTPLSPWGDAQSAGDPPEEHCYYFKVDINYDNKITHEGEEIRKPVIVWTYNPDRPQGDDAYLIKSW